MKKPTAFLFIPLLFVFNPLNLASIQSHVNFPWESHRAQMVPGYRSTTTDADDSSGDDSVDSQTPSNTDEPDTSATAAVTTASADASNSNNPASISSGASSGTTATDTIVSLSDLIPSIVPTIPGIPNTGIVAATTEVLPASTSASLSSTPPTTIASIAGLSAEASTSIDMGVSIAATSASETAAASATQDESIVSSTTTSTDEDVAETPPVPSNPEVVTPPTSSSNVFATGAVTFRFDDGWQSQYDVAVPALGAAGIKGTFYIITRQLLEDGFAGFMSTAEVQQLAASGQEIGAHTQTHPHLPTLSADAQRQEIAGAKQDLEAIGIQPQTFSYPYGEFTPESVQVVRDAGYASAVTTVESAVSESSNLLQVQSPSVTLAQSPAEIKAMIDTAVANHQWLVLTFHRVDTSGDAYSITPENFLEIVNYVKDQQIPTVTVSEGASQLQ